MSLEELMHTEDQEVQIITIVLKVRGKNIANRMEIEK